MAELPFNIPPSLVSYVEQYDAAPLKTTARLEKQLHKRGAHAAGYFLLAWFHHQQENKQEAIDYALKAKCLAPGSPFFERLHYFFSHPNLFDAWRCNNSMAQNQQKKYHSFSTPSTFLDLNLLIEKLSNIESTRIKLDPNNLSDTDSTVDEESDDVDDITSETLAKIYEQQGEIKAALSAYKQLKRHGKKEEAFYEKQIQRLKKMRKNEGEKES